MEVFTFVVLFLVYFDTIVFLCPANGGLADQIQFLFYLKAGMLPQTFLTAAILKNPKWRL